MKNQPKIYQKSVKNRSKIHQKSILEASWDFLGCLGGVLAASWGVLGASWRRPGASWWPTWLQLGSQNGAKIHQKSKPKSINFLMPLGIGFLKDFDGFRKQNEGMLASKIAS